MSAETEQELLFDPTMKKKKKKKKKLADLDDGERRRGLRFFFFLPFSFFSSVEKTRAGLVGRVARCTQPGGPMVTREPVVLCRYAVTPPCTWPWLCVVAARRPVSISASVSCARCANAGTACLTTRKRNVERVEHSAETRRA